MNIEQGQDISMIPIPTDAKRVEFRFNRRKAYAYGWWRNQKCGCEMLDVIHMVAAYAVGADKNRADFHIVVPGGSFPMA